jgi:LPS-assembly lipoprotein
MAILGSCGFRPLYGGAENKAIYQELGQIKISTIKNRIGQQVHNLLLDQLNSHGRPDNPLYTLSVRMAVNKEEIGLKFTEEATRARLTLIANYLLVHSSSGKMATEGSVRSVNSYNISNSEFARLASETDALERGSREISDEIKTRLSLYFSQRGT